MAGIQPTGAVGRLSGVADLRRDHGVVFVLLPRQLSDRRRLISGPLYLRSVVMAKFGYQRKTLAELRTPRASTPSRSRRASAASGTDAPHVSG